MNLLTDLLDFIRIIFGAQVTRKNSCQEVPAKRRFRPISVYSSGFMFHSRPVSAKPVYKKFLLILLLLGSIAYAAEVKNLTVYFDKDKAYVSNGEAKKLSAMRWADYVMLKGHTDNEGNDTYNMELSKKRVEAVATFLHNMDAGMKIETDYYGERKPLNNNADDKEKAANRRVEISYICDPLLRVSVPVQHFEIDNSTDQVICCEHGTEIHIPAGAFDNKNVKISVSEYYAPDEIFAANLTTKCSANPIETAGMININAEVDGQPVEPQKDLQYKFPRKNKSRDFRFFEGVRDPSLAMNWELKAPKGNGPRPGNEAGAGFQPQVKVMQQPKDISTDLWKATYSAGMDPQIIDTILSKVNYADKTLAGGCLANSRIDIGINKRGTITSFKTNYTGKNTECDRPLQQYIRACLPAKFPVREQDSWLRLEAGSLGAMTVDNIAIFATRPAVGNGNVWMGGFGKDFTTDYETDNIVLNASQMGWINCDRFMNGIKLTNYTVKTDSDANVRLMMKKYKSFFVNEYWWNGEKAISKVSGTFNFFRIPDNEEIVLISTKKEEGTIYLAIEQTKISKAPFTQFHYKPVTQAELEAAIKALTT